jgi:hypothetical protein
MPGANVFLQEVPDPELRHLKDNGTAAGKGSGTNGAPLGRPSHDLARKIVMLAADLQVILAKDPPINLVVNHLAVTQAHTNNV